MPTEKVVCSQGYATILGQGYCILINTRNGGRVGEMNQREGKRGNSSQSWVENTRGGWR